jgi:hypothetical protein
MYNHTRYHLFIMCLDGRFYVIKYFTSIYFIDCKINRDAITNSCNPRLPMDHQMVLHFSSYIMLPQILMSFNNDISLFCNSIHV